MINPAMPTRKTNLQEVTEPEYGESIKGTTRAQKRRESAEDINLTNVDLVFEKLTHIIGSTNISSPNADISPFEIDQLTEELISVRDAKDIVEGRESALKAYATEVINMRIATSGLDFATQSGYLVSPENGVKLSKEVSGGKLNVDVDLLEKILDADQFKSVINRVTTTIVTELPDSSVKTDVSTVLVLNEEALEKQLKIGSIGMEQVMQATTPSKMRTAFYVRSL